MFRRSHQYALPLLLTLAAAPLCLPTYAAPDKNPIKAGNAVETAMTLQQTPDGALRVFLAALIGPDTAILHQVTLPLSEADFRLLADRAPASDQDRAKGVIGIASMPFHELKPGDVVPLPGGHSLTVTKSDVDDNHVLLQMPGGPVPILIRRINKLWYVDAASIIAARKTAAELRRTHPKQPPHTTKNR